jgi:subfamily B ATP-binding cassette protein MsbA
MFLPYLNKYLIDNVLRYKDVKLLFVVVISYFILTLISLLFSNYQEYILNKINTLVVFKMRRDLVSVINRIPMTSFYQNSESYLYNRLINDTGFIQESFMSSLIRIVAQLLMIVIGLFFIFALSVPLSLLVIGLIGINVFVSHYLSRILAKLQLQQVEDYTNYCESIHESVHATFTSKLCNLYNYLQGNMIRAYRRFFHSLLRLMKVSIRNLIIIHSLHEFCLSLIILLSGLMIVRDQFTVGGLVAFLAYFRMISAPASAIIQSYIGFQKNMPLYTRINDQLSMPVEYSANHSQALSFGQCISLEGLSFAYPSGAMILDDLSISFQTKEIYVLKGLSGSGKTTLAMLLLGIYKASKGTISYDDTILEDKYIASLRMQTSYLEHEPLMFNASIFENIQIGNLKATPEDVYAAAKLANADVFIGKMPEAYNTMLGKSGINLSAGQKQRLAIARALLKKPRLIIFDEPTSNIDSESEYYIHRTIKDLPSDTFKIVISHKQETLGIATKIIELSEGRIVPREAMQN